MSRECIAVLYRFVERCSGRSGTWLRHEGDAVLRRADDRCSFQPPVRLRTGPTTCTRYPVPSSTACRGPRRPPTRLLRAAGRHRTPAPFPIWMDRHKVSTHGDCRHTTCWQAPPRLLRSSSDVAARCSRRKQSTDIRTHPRLRERPRKQANNSTVFERTRLRWRRPSTAAAGGAGTP